MNLTALPACSRKGFRHDFHEADMGIGDDELDTGQTTLFEFAKQASVGHA